jgi:gliding motility-associated-like protein
MTKRIYLFFTALSLFSCVSVYSQISVNPTNGCAPMGVTFTGINGATNPLWNFGDGVTSPNNNATHTYATVGTFTVTYTATGISAQTLTVGVHGKPTPSFTVTSPTEGCVPYTVSFQDHSTGGGNSSIQTWEWTFGDGGSNSVPGATQSYIYTIPGQFNVSIKVIDANGCDSSEVINNLVTVSQPPTISLVTNPNPASACVPPLTVTFSANGSTSHSPIGSALTYNWNFGGGVTSTSATPSPQTYTASGVYPVQIKLTDANHCSDSVTTNVTIHAPTATFTTADTVCLNAVFHPHGSTAGATQIWNFGDSPTNFTNDSLHTYTAGGTYVVTLTVTSGACSSIASHTVVVQDPVANFSVSPTYMCSLPKTISLTNTSTPGSGTTYVWNYYQHYTQYGITPMTSTSVSPTFTLTHLDTNRYTINTLNIMDYISLTITTAQGCTASKTFLLVDTIYLPTAYFVPSLYQGCAPLTVNFADSSKVGPHEHITSWKYLFGDGATTTIASAPGNSVHTYTNTGIYYPKLVIQTQDGCGDTSYTIKIEVGKKPNASFTLAPSSICIGDSVHFTNTTPAADSVDTWHYYADGNYYASSCSDNPNPSWPFTHATGAQNVSLVACFRGCCDTVTQTGAVTVKGPLAMFSAAMDCDSSLVYNFTGNISAATSWNWDFGDGTVITASTAPNIAHTYSVTGDYNVILTAFNSGTGCAPSVDTVKIHVRSDSAKFTYNNLQCAGVAYTFDATTSVGTYTYGTNGYIWLWGDTTHPSITSGPITTHSFVSHGTHTVTLIIKDINECPDTLRKVIKAYSVTAAFIPSKNTICANSTITFSNTSFADTTITNYSWNFGDGIGTSTQQNPTYTYNLGAGINNINVVLTVTTSLGCTATVTKNIVISRPSAIFSISSPVNICSGDSVHYVSSNSFPNMTWAYGDGTTLGPTPPSTNNWHHFAASGAYTATLTVIDSIGCTANFINTTQPINVQNIPTVIITSPAFSNDSCWPLTTTFTDNSIVNVFQSRNWNTYNGQIINNGLSTISPTTYTTPGTYSVTLTETTTNGCTASATYTFIVNGPKANFTLTPVSGIICLGQTYTFTINDSSNVGSWYWDFGDGSGGDTLVSPVSHTYNYHPPNPTGTTTVTLIYKNHLCHETAQSPISIYQVIANFLRNGGLTKQDTAHCLGTADSFSNTSTYPGGTNTNFWSFGNGATSTALSPTYQYSVAGTYSVELIITNSATGCADTAIKQMIIYPQFTVAVTGNDTICVGSSENLTSTPIAATYSWTASIPPNPINMANPVVSPSVTTTYTLLASDVNGCKDSASVVVFVEQKPKPINWDTTIVIGQSVTLPGGQGPGYTYTWSPTTSLSCTNCPTPVYNSTVNASFIEIIADDRGCFRDTSTFKIDILPEASIAVPTAFTPNGDGKNDVIYVAGWGIKSLQYFKIFNRWGELVFQSEDITVGWDGTYKGVPQNIETYVYEASVLSFISDKPLTKKGYINLLR